tara:strand:+ start:531 stop:734 length:204 start_codon:yes stop_codon:yes gene_type:complete
MFEWFFKKQKEKSTHVDPLKKPQDTIECSLWEMKEEYDLETEEIFATVDNKRKNLKYFYECIKKGKS